MGEDKFLEKDLTLGKRSCLINFKANIDKETSSWFVLNMCSSAEICQMKPTLLNAPYCSMHKQKKVLPKKLGIVSLDYVCGNNNNNCKIYHSNSVEKKELLIG